jgi:hypothetical protein
MPGCRLKLLTRPNAFSNSTAAAVALVLKLLLLLLVLAFGRSCCSSAAKLSRVAGCCCSRWQLASRTAGTSRQLDSSDRARTCRQGKRADCHKGKGEDLLQHHR